MPISFTKIRKPEDLPQTLFQISRDHYVGARLSFVGGAVFASQLAMHQCIETSTKALLKSLDRGRNFKGASGHRIKAFLNELAPTRPPIRELLASSDTSKVIDVLDEGYSQIRYGDGVLGTELGSTLEAFDSIGSRLLGCVAAALGTREVSLHVGERTLTAFLWRLQIPVISIEHHGTEPWRYATVCIDATPSRSG